VVEWATSWTLLLMVSGAILWWPRGQRRRGGVLWPRTRLSGRQWLRDLHAVLGAYGLPVLFVLAATGLMWTVHAGDRRWNRIAAPPQRPEPTSKVVPGARRVGLDAALAGAKLDPATEVRAIYIGIPGPQDEPGAPYALFVSDEDYRAPSKTESILVDAYTGAELRREGWAGRSAIGKVDASRYPIHVGTILGLPGRIAACLASLILAALCVTGPWMWWKRRPRGKLGVPSSARGPAWLYLLVAALGWVLPTVGVTLLVVVAIELARALIRKRAGPSASPS
jgi:uncharacterized iron-regulated membrane protein